jgi:hypothetical protein
VFALMGTYAHLSKFMCPGLLTAISVSVYF